MKRTFQQDDAILDIPSAGIFWQLYEYAKSKGVPIYNNVSMSDYSEYTGITMFNTELCGTIATKEKQYDKNAITFEQFFEYCDNWREYQPKKLKLNDEYTAEILDGRIKVGCQYITFERIKELYQMIHPSN